jgi:hypothetical protein
MSPVTRLNNAPRCHATSKRTGKRCKGPAVNGFRVCRFHGARGGAPKGEKNGAYRHGLHTKKAVSQRRALRALQRLLQPISAGNF